MKKMYILNSMNANYFSVVCGINVNEKRYVKVCFNAQEKDKKKRIYNFVPVYVLADLMQRYKLVLKYGGTNEEFENDMLK